MKTKSSRLSVRKTHKLFIGGAFPRSESGRVLSAIAADGVTALGNYSQASRKDFRDAVVKARAVSGKWSGASAFLRAQILYRTAELLEARRDELAAAVRDAVGGAESRAQDEISRSVDLLVHYAGWTDKFGPLFSSVNPVASPHFNFTFPEPTGVVVIVCPDTPPLLALCGLLAPVILSGNTAIVLASERAPLPALAFAEIVATSDVPPGVVNILAGSRAELAPHFASHMDVNAIVNGHADADLDRTLQAGSATNLKRYAAHQLEPKRWFDTPENTYWILDTVEMKTAWHPVGV